MKRPYPSEEPSMVSRDYAKYLRENFVALRQQGFTETQALMIVGQIAQAFVCMALSNPGDNNG